MSRHSRILLIVAALSLSWLEAGAQPDIRAELFGEADTAMRTANEVEAHVLAPASYELAAEHYRRAEQTLARGRSIADIRADLAETVRYFRQAVERTEVARVTLTAAYEARQDALAAEAPTYAEALWREAEVTFAEAVRRLEGESVNRARSRGAEAEQQFRAAELAAIESNYLSGARRLIEEAKDARVGRYAPKTLARAESLLAEAEARLRSNRYDTDEPRSLARLANYEARHAIYLASRIRAVSDRDLTNEDLLLEAEDAIERIAGRLDLVAELDAGFDAPTEAVVEAIGGLQSDRERMSRLTQQVAFLEDELLRLEMQLGEESQRRKVQEQIQQRFEQLAAVFTREEAQVLRRGDEIIVRMGLNFDSGSAVIKPEHFVLLRKIQTAMDLFPGSRIEIQGHTDSFGADDSNLRLSEQRAGAVEQYLRANIEDLGMSTLTAVGYGETVPLANNETPEGRLRNRRIDLAIEPNLEQLEALLADAGP